MNIKFIKFNTEDACIILQSTDEINTARINQISGPAYTAVEVDDKGNIKEILGCGGVRILGVGEVWALNSEKAKSMKLSLLKESRKWLDKIMRDHALYRIWSESPIPCNENFIEHMNFRKLNAYLKG